MKQSVQTVGWGQRVRSRFGFPPSIANNFLVCVDVGSCGGGASGARSSARMASHLTFASEEILERLTQMGLQPRRVA